MALWILCAGKIDRTPRRLPVLQELNLKNRDLTDSGKVSCCFCLLQHGLRSAAIVYLTTRRKHQDLVV